MLGFESGDHGSNLSLERVSLFAGKTDLFRYLTLFLEFSLFILFYYSKLKDVI